MKWWKQICNFIRSKLSKNFKNTDKRKKHFKILRSSFCLSNSQIEFYDVLVTQKKFKILLENFLVDTKGIDLRIFLRLDARLTRRVLRDLELYVTHNVQPQRDIEYYVYYLVHKLGEELGYGKDN